MAVLSLFSCLKESNTIQVGKEYFTWEAWDDGFDFWEPDEDGRESSAEYTTSAFFAFYDLSDGDIFRPKARVKVWYADLEDREGLQEKFRQDQGRGRINLEGEPAANFYQRPPDHTFWVEEDYYSGNEFRKILQHNRRVMMEIFLPPQRRGVQAGAHNYCYLTFTHHPGRPYMHRWIGTDQFRAGL